MTEMQEMKARMIRLQKSSGALEKAAQDVVEDAEGLRRFIPMYLLQEADEIRARTHRLRSKIEEEARK